MKKDACRSCSLGWFLRQPVASAFGGSLPSIAAESVKRRVARHSGRCSSILSPTDTTAALIADRVLQTRRHAAGTPALRQQTTAWTNVPTHKWVASTVTHFAAIGGRRDPWSARCWRPRWAICPGRAVDTCRCCHRRRRWQDFHRAACLFRCAATANRWAR